MKRRLDIDWNQILEQEIDIEHKMNRFITKLHEFVEEGVPKKFSNPKPRKKLNNKFPMNNQLWSKIKLKQRKSES